ncbi:hypothetical protein [Streptomyces sp. NPDC056921]|uniref:hypothetical protein n=1 Tax=Streptomyces sp. NPDC056921 TaxID=3345966 RepID=UPI00362759E7
MSDHEQLLHLVDRARRGVALPAELDQLAAGITEQAARITALERLAAGNRRHVQLIVPELEKAEARVTELEAETTKLVRWHREDGTNLAKAEAAIARVRALATRWAVLRAYGSAATELRAALDEQQPTT